MAYLTPDPVRTVQATDFTGNYMAIGDPLATDSLIIRVYNQTNQPILFSFDGVNTTEFIDVGMVYELNCEPGVNAIQSGTQFYVNGFAGPYNYGVVYLSVYHD